MPEHELFETLHVLRRKLLLWLREHGTPVDVDAVMDRVMRVSASTGSLRPVECEERGRWAFVLGEGNCGRFARHSLRTSAPDDESTGGGPCAVATVADSLKPDGLVPSDGSLQSDDSTADLASLALSDEGERGEAASSELTISSAPQLHQGETRLEMEDDGQLAVEVDVQVMQITLKSSHPQALPDDVAALPDVRAVFGEVSMQACLTERSSLRACYRIVGRCHDIEFWPSRDEQLPQLDHFRPYYPEELYPSEKVWLPSVLEPVKRAYLTFPVPLEIYLPEDPLPEDATVAYLVGKQPDQSGVWREIFVYRHRRMVQIYRIESHGRRYYRSLEYTTDARFCCTLRRRLHIALARPRALDRGGTCSVPKHCSSAAYARHRARALPPRSTVHAAIDRPPLSAVALVGAARGWAPIRLLIQQDLFCGDHARLDC